MKLSERTVSVVLSEEGRQVMQLAALNLPDSSAIGLHVVDTDDMGLWVWVSRRDGDHLVLVRWDYVLAVDFLAGETRIMGIRG